MNIKLPQIIAEIIERLEHNGFEGYAVGGCVRDTLLEREIHDWDIASSATPQQIRECFSGEKLVATGEKHGTMTLIIDRMPVEITTFRVDGKYSDGRRPDSVRFSSKIEEDLSRRDFTVNAMAYSPRSGLVDLFGGAEDVFAGIIRCVGDAERRFNEDALRIMRAFRFYSKLKTVDGRSFLIEAETLKKMRYCMSGLRHISAERIGAELCGILLSDQAYSALMLMDECDVWNYVNGVECQLIPPIGFDALPYDTAARMAAILMPFGAEKAGGIMSALRFKNVDIIRARKYIENFSADMDDDYAILKLMNRIGEKDARCLLEMRAALGEKSEVSSAAFLDNLIAEKRCWSLKMLAVNGGDMAETGFCGREIGDMLDILLDKVMHGEPNERDGLMKIARNMAKLR